MSITILGGGLAGLAAAWRAGETGTACRLYERDAALGGTARTYRSGPFSFDAGAHRLHDRSSEVTALFRDLLGDALQEVDAPSRIQLGQTSVRFPLSLANLIANLSPATAARMILDLGWSRLGPQNGSSSFEDVTVRRYGRRAADAFVLRYSEKLWGVPCAQLAPAAAGGRLHGLSLKGLLRDVLRRPASSAHMEGRFYYPSGGIGRLADALAAACLPETIRLGAEVSGIHHDGRRIRAVRFADGSVTRVQEVICSLPVVAALQLLDPCAPTEVLAQAARLRYRDVLLVAVFLDRPSISECATTYFPGADVPFTRLHEPRNRCRSMAPPGQTSLVAEIPVDDGLRSSPALERQVADEVLAALQDMQWIRGDEVLGRSVRRLRRAYPVLDLRTADVLEDLRRYLARFENLHLLGRAATFRYLHIHDVVAEALELVSGLCAKSKRRHALALS